ncbi:MAG: EamA family transporter [Clostridia bacterium]|nr:EamA family transporter [Clostridia bacterium]
MKENKTLLATLAALGAQVIFGFSFMFTKIALGYASPLTVIADRYIVAFFGLTIVMLATKTKINMHKNIWKLVLMSIFQPVLYFIFETYGIQLTTSAFSSIMISMIPVVSMIGGIFVLAEVPSPVQYVFSALSVAGVVIMSLTGNAEGTVTVPGIILLFGAVVSSVAYNTSSRKISGEFTALERTYAMTSIGLVSFVVISIIENIKNPVKVIASFAHFEYTAAILYLGLISSVVAFLLLNYANTYLPVAKTTAFSNITTVVSVVAGAIFLDEKITAVTVISTGMIIAGVTGVQIFGVSKVKNKEDFGS